MQTWPEFVHNLGIKKRARTKKVGSVVPSVASPSSTLLGRIAACLPLVLPELLL
jgi:hypothetical protein